jgi:hypothetical protein
MAQVRINIPSAMSSPNIPLSLESGINKKRTAVKLSGVALLFLSFQTLGA